MSRFSSRASLATVLSLVLVACTGGDEETLSEPADATVELTQTIEERPAGFPCPPFSGVYVPEADVYGDNDGDGLSNCQEEQAGSAPGNDDTDGDGVSDGIEMGDLQDPTDTDRDGDPDFDDTDDDDDGCSTAEEGVDDLDEDGVPAYLDPDENPCAPDETGATGDTGTTTTGTTTKSN
jgi:hypothetical protein